MGQVAYAYLNSFSADRLYTSELDVYRRQILTSKDGPHPVRVNLYSTEQLTPSLPYMTEISVVIRQVT